MRTTAILLAASAHVLSTSAVPQANYATSGTAGGVVPVGGNCVPNQDTCALGSQCYATNSVLQPRCGNFQAACTINEQCAFNTCNTQQGLCNGFLSTIGGSTASSSASMSSAWMSVYATTTSSASRSATGTTTISTTRTVTATTTVGGFRNGTMTIQPTGSLRPTGSARPSSSITPYTGAASMVGAGSGLFAAIFAVGAWAL